MPLLPLVARRDPLEMLAAVGGEPGAMLLDLPDPIHPVTLIGCRPVDELRIAADEREPLARLARFVAAAPPVGDLPFPLGGGVVACLTYELGTAIASRPLPIRTTGPLAVLRRYDPLVVYDRTRRQYALATSDPSRCVPWLDRLAAPVVAADAALAAGPLAAGMTPAAHHAAVERIRALLAAGDCYQVNLTLPFTAPLAGPAWALFARLARRHPVAGGAYLDLGDAQVVCNSPELLLRVRGRDVLTRPIKGTRPRGDDAVRDAALAAELRRDPKERAEHVMIVDLERNDLGRVCTPGSVHVPRFAALESHATLHHLVSDVAGTLRPEVTLADLLAATFPGGSITGAPKQRAMEVIAELETGPRGVYCGALGLLAANGDAELTLPIRTGTVAGGGVRWHAGGGIVADSDPAREHAEAWLKTAALRLALGEPDVAAWERCSSG
ncbi:MAG: anthranilate synthase component I family protein [bacterium]|nr:anthranilate synthase component I family protein [bacterium]